MKAYGAADTQGSGRVGLPQWRYMYHAQNEFRENSSKGRRSRFDRVMSRQICIELYDEYEQT